MWQWIFENKEWLFSGILVAIPTIIISFITFIKKNKTNDILINSEPREENIEFYPDPRLKIERPKAHINTEYYILFNTSLLNKNSIHNVKVTFNYYSNKKTPCIATMYETFEKGKDFIVNQVDKTLYVSGEGLIDWSVWILKKNTIDKIEILYGSMIYHGIKENIIGSTSLLLVKVEKDFWQKYESRYYNQKDFSKDMPVISELINKKQSTIIVDFHDLASFNFFEIYGEVKKSQM